MILILYCVSAPRDMGVNRTKYPLSVHYISKKKQRINPWTYNIKSGHDKHLVEI